IHRKGRCIVCENMAAPLAVRHRLGALGRAALSRCAPEPRLLDRSFLARTRRKRQTRAAACFREYRDWPYLFVERCPREFPIGRLLSESGCTCATAAASN